MNSLFKKIIAGFCAISITISCVAPAFATNQTEVTSEFGTFWEQYLKWQYDVSEIFGDNIGGFCKLVAVGLSADLCGKSDDSKHHGYITGPAVTLFGETKYPAKCNLCGQGFSVTDAQISEAYTEAVNEMPATGYDSAGKLLWQPRWIEDTKVWGVHLYSPYCNAVSSENDGYLFSNEYALTSVVGSQINIKFLKAANMWYFSPCEASGTGYHEFSAPIDGTYKIVKSNFLVGLVLNDTFRNFNMSWANTSRSFDRFAGGSLSIYETWKQTYSSSSYMQLGYITEGSLVLSTPVFEITPLASDTTTINTTYNINTRVNSFQGDYYDSVTNNYYTNTTIINETTNNYYDMTTNNYYTMSNWSYDYQSRTYFVTLEDGTTITVQFGDDALIITNNNVEHSYQYVIKNNTPSTDPDTPTTCKHNWTETIDVAPTCLESGHANYTCSLCGETYEQILSAKGHTWTVKEHVNTVYGENGEIVTQGHTLYECSTCGEQWYTETATPPPDVSGGANILAWLQSFQTWLGAQLELVIDKIQVTINNTETNIENVTNVVIEETNNAYNVFYVTTEDGNEKPIGEVAGDTLSASGKLLNFLYKLCFEGALSKVDDSISAMDGFYFDDGAGLEGSIWD